MVVFIPLIIGIVIFAIILVAIMILGGIGMVRKGPPPSSGSRTTG